MALKIIKDEIAYDGKYLQTVRRYFHDRRGKLGVWELVKRKTFGRIVSVFPVTANKEAILVKVYRVPFKCYVIECCAGLMDKKGESEEDAVRRELMEETGYSVKRLKSVVFGPFNPGLSGDEIVLYLGLGAQKTQEAVRDDSEDIEVIKVPISKLDAYLRHPPQGVKVDIKVFCALYHAQKYLVSL